MLAQMTQGQSPTAIQRHMYAPTVLSQLEDQAILVQAAKKQNVNVDRSEVTAEIDKQVEAEMQANGVAGEVGELRTEHEAQIRAGVESQREEIRSSLITQKLKDKLHKNVTLSTPGLKPRTSRSTRGIS